MFTVLVGTLFPIIAEAVRGVKVSVGEPYFNRMAIPISFGLLLFVGIGPALPWGRADGAALKRALLWPLPSALVGAVLAWLLGGRTGPVLLTSALAGYALWVTLDQISRPTRQRMKRGESAPQAFATATARAPRVVGAYLTHFGLIMTFVAIAVSSSFQVSAEATLGPGEELSVGSYKVKLAQPVGVEQRPHLQAQVARLEVTKNGRAGGTLEPSLNHYPTRMEPIGTPAVKTTLTNDLYLTLMSVTNDGRAGLRAIVTPAVVWIWIGVLIMTAGTAMCLLSPAAPRPGAAAEVAP
jgi:cytochrome c-type biogenesis protein CcmF